MSSWDESTEQGRASLGIAERFYDAVTQPDAWFGAVSSLLASFGGKTALLVLDSPDGLQPITMPGFTDVAQRLYAEHYHKVDLWTLAARRLEATAPDVYCLLGQDVVPVEVFEESEAWQDFSRHHIGAFHLIGAGFKVGSGAQAILGMHRPRDDGAFAPSDIRRLHPLLPHLSNALFLARRFDAAENLAAAGFAALEQHSAAIAIIERGRGILFANGAMERLAATGALHLRREDGTALPGRRARLALRRATDNETFSRLVEHATRLGAGGAMQLPLVGEDRCLEVLVMPLPKRLSPRSSAVGAFDSGRVLVIVRDHARPVALQADLLQSLYGLTAAEIAVAHTLLGGRSPEAVAGERSVSIPTIRTQVRQILQKTGARSLRELEAILRAP